MPLYGPLPSMARWTDIYARQIARGATSKQALDYVKSIGSGLTAQQLADIPLRAEQSRRAAEAINASRPQQAALALGAIRGAAGAPVLIRAVALIEPVDVEPGAARPPPVETVVQFTAPAGMTLQEITKSIRDLANAVPGDPNYPELRGGGNVVGLRYIGVYGV